MAFTNNGQEDGNQAGRHQEVGHKSLLQSDALYQVIKYNLLPNRQIKQSQKLLFLPPITEIF